MPVTREPSGYEPPKLKYKRSAYPQSPNSALPRQFAVICGIGPRGSGKTFGITQLIRAYERDPPQTTEGATQAIRTFVISPTYDANQCFTALRSIDDDDVYRTYSEEVLNEILSKIDTDKRATEEYQKQLKLFIKFKKLRRVEDLSPDELFLLDEVDYQEPKKPKYPHGCSYFLILDDCVGSAALKAGKNNFLQLLLMNRHRALNVVIMAQSLKSIPRTIRANVSTWIVHRFGTRSHLSDLYEECGSALVTEEQFEELYDEATREDHSALVIDFSQPKERRFSSNFKYILKVT